jgi:hypothetical protein
MGYDDHDGCHLDEVAYTGQELFMLGLGEPIQKLFNIKSMSLTSMSTPLANESKMSGLAA